MAIFRDFTNIVLELSAGLQLKLILIESPNIFHWKPKKQSGCDLGKFLARLSQIIYWLKIIQEGCTNIIIMEAVQEFTPVHNRFVDCM